MASLDFCTFWIGDELYGVRLQDVREVNQDLLITPIFQGSESIRGLMNIRGRIHLILDLRVMLGLPILDGGEGQCVVVFKATQGEDFGVLVDRIEGVTTIGPELVSDETAFDQEALSSRRFVRRPLIAGVGRLPHRLFIILATARLLPEIGAPAAASAP